MGGAISWLLLYPIDVVKSRIQTDGMFGPKKYRSMLDCVAVSYREEGLRVFTRGLSSALIRSFPTNATVFAVSAQVIRFAESVEVSVPLSEAIPATLGVVVDNEETLKIRKKGAIEYPIPSAEIYGDYHYHPVPRLEFPGAHYLTNYVLRGMDSSYHSVLYSMHINFKRPRPDHGPGYIFGQNQIPAEDHGANDADSVHPTPYWAEDANFDPKTAVKFHEEDAAIADANSPLDDEMDIRGFGETSWRREGFDKVKDALSDRGASVSRAPLISVVAG